MGNQYDAQPLAARPHPGFSSPLRGSGQAAGRGGAPGLFRTPRSIVAGKYKCIFNGFSPGLGRSLPPNSDMLASMQIPKSVAFQLGGS